MLSIAFDDRIAILETAIREIIANFLQDREIESPHRGYNHSCRITIVTLILSLIRIIDGSFVWIVRIGKTGDIAKISY